MNKKGQMTIFIVMGILILLFGVIFFFLRGQSDGNGLDNNVIISQQVPVEFNPVAVFVENCLTQTARQGLKLLGERGGFISPEANGFVADADVSSGSAIRFASNWVLPYWWHLSSDNKCSGNCQFSLVPESKLYLYKSSGSPSIEGQLETYVDEHLNECISDWSYLESQGYTIEEIGSPKTTVKIFDDSVQFALNYPITASKVSRKSISTFATTVDVHLKDIYDLASLITTMEANYHFLENYMLDVIVAFSAADKDKLPPMTGMVFDFKSPPTWSKSWIGDRLKELLTSYIQLIKLYGTANFEYYNFPSDSFKEDFYNTDMMLPGNQSFSDLAVEFDYLGWQPYFDLNCDGDDCKPDSFVTELMSLFGFHHYKSLYDLSFPAMITIRDTSALLYGEKGYSFNFALEGNIRNNQALKNDYATITSPYQSSSIMFCDESKRVSGEVAMNIIDSISSEAIPDVEVVYGCGGDSCIIGTTDSDGKVAGKFPLCFNGVISFIKQDYITYSEVFTSKAGKTKNINVNLNHIITKKFSVKKALMEKVSDGKFDPVYSTISSPLNLSADETAIISLKRKSSPNEAEFSAFAELRANQTVGEIKLAPGEYELKIDLLYYGDVSIPARTESISGETVEYPAVDFNYTNPLPNGGLHCDTSEHYIKESFIAKNPNLIEDNIIIFKALSPNIAAIPIENRRVEDLEVIGEVDSDSFSQYCYSLSPSYEK